MQQILQLCFCSETEMSTEIPFPRPVDKDVIPLEMLNVLKN